MFKNNHHYFFIAVFSLFIFIIIASLIFSKTSSAEQLQFLKTQKDEQYQFSYQWLDHQKNLQSLSFSLPQKAIFNRYRNFAIYQPRLAQEYVNKSLNKHFKKTPIQGIRVAFEEDNGYLQVSIKGENQALIEQASQQINVLRSEFVEEYLAQKYYHHFRTPEQEVAIKPDHGRIANESVNDLKTLKALILEQSSIKNIRKVSNYVLSFIQNIPYSTLESRVTSSGAGFSPPLKLLWENQGDCDSKVTLTATLLRVLMPRIKMAMVYIDNHALIGINVRPKADDITVIDNGITYVLAEPTGPALFALGKIAEESEQAIYSGHYSLETFHAKRKSRSLTNNEEENTSDDEDASDEFTEETNNADDPPS